MSYRGDIAEDATISKVFTTNDGAGGVVAPSSAFEAADYKIYKNTLATVKSTTNGITVANANTGTHAIYIDTSIDTGDAGFWEIGNDYFVVLDPDETVDGQTIEAEIFDFSIENRFMRGTDIAALASGVNVTQISGDSVAADNLELQYDGGGLLGDAYPLRQDQGAGIAGGLAIRITMASVTVILGSQQDLDNTYTSDDGRWTGDDDGTGAEFIFRCTPTDVSSIPVDVHFEGYYDEPSGPFNNNAILQIYDFQNSQWDTILTLSNASADETHDAAIAHIHKSPGSGTLETVAYTIGDVLLKFKQDTQETGNACLLIDYLTVGFVSALISADIKTVVDDVKILLRADKIVDTSGTPWVVDYYVEGTIINSIMSKEMKNTSGADIVNVNNLLGRLQQE